jgi:hypothetical protein
VRRGFWVLGFGFRVWLVSLGLGFGVYGVGSGGRV